MKRRTLLRRTGAVGATLAVAGCLRRSRDEDALSIADSTITESDDGYLVYELVISNTADRKAEGTLYVNSELDGDAETKVRQVSLDAHSTTIVRIEYDIKFKNVTSFSPSSSITEN